MRKFFCALIWWLIVLTGLVGIFGVYFLENIEIRKAFFLGSLFVIFIFYEIVDQIDPKQIAARKELAELLYDPNEEIAKQREKEETKKMFKDLFRYMLISLLPFSILFFFEFREFGTALFMGIIVSVPCSILIVAFQKYLRDRKK